MSTPRLAPPLTSCKRFFGSSAVGLLVVICSALPTRAEPSGSGASPTIGRVEFDYADAPPAVIEVDLKEGMLSAFTGIGKAAVQGVVEGLNESRQGPESEAIRQSAQHLQAIDDILEIVSRVIHEVRVRVYEDVNDGAPQAYASLVEHYQSKLDGTDWQNVVRVRGDHESITVCVLQQDAAVRGLFVMVSNGRDDLVLANVVCNLTPETVKELTSQVTRIGMKAGLEDVIEEAVEEIGRELR